ncbi:MAG: hypothetical protein ABIS20_09840 [Thermoanaerobaculia bacterium]
MKRLAILLLPLALQALPAAAAAAQAPGKPEGIHLAVTACGDRCKEPFHQSP